jgi:hypothetical protein
MSGERDAAGDVHLRGLFDRVADAECEYRQLVLQSPQRNRLLVSRKRLESRDSTARHTQQAFIHRVRPCAPDIAGSGGPSTGQKRVRDQREAVDQFDRAGDERSSRSGCAKFGVIQRGCLMVLERSKAMRGKLRRLSASVVNPLLSGQSKARVTRPRVI